MSETMMRSLLAVGLIAARSFFHCPGLLLPSVLLAHLPQSSALVQPPPRDLQTFLFLISSPSANNGTVRLWKPLPLTVFTQRGRSRSNETPFCRENEENCDWQTKDKQSLYVPEEHINRMEVVLLTRRSRLNALITNRIPTCPWAREWMSTCTCFAVTNPVEGKLHQRGHPSQKKKKMVSITYVNYLWRHAPRKKSAIISAIPTNYNKQDVITE